MRASGHVVGCHCQNRDEWVVPLFDRVRNKSLIAHAPSRRSFDYSHIISMSSQSRRILCDNFEPPSNDGVHSNLLGVQDPLDRQMRFWRAGRPSCITIHLTGRLVTVSLLNSAGVWFSQRSHGTSNWILLFYPWLLFLVFPCAVSHIDRDARNHDPPRP